MRVLAIFLIMIQFGCGDDAPEEGPTLTLTAEPTRVLADGRAATNIVVRVVDESGVPVEGGVTIDVDGADNVLEPYEEGAVDGVVATKLRSVTAGPRTIRASYDGHEVTTTVTFTALSEPCAGTPLFGLPLLRARFVSLVRLDGNSTMDLLTSTVLPMSEPVLQLNLGNGDGTFRGVQELPWQPGFVVAADLNGDANRDLLTLGRLWLGTGNGTVTQGPLLASTRAWERAADGDFDGDGRTDVVVSDATAVGIFHGNGDGTFADVVVREHSDAGPVLAADFDGDGRTDIFAATTSGQSFVFLGRADRTFSDPTIYPSPAFPQARIAHVNGDAHPDVLIASGTLQILLGRGDGTFAAASESAIPTANGFQVGDVDGDRDVDLVTHGKYVNGHVGITVWRNDGTGSFTSAFDIESSGGATIAIEDFNSDGRSDLLVGFTAGLGIAPGDGSGHFAVLPGRFSPDNGNGLVAADVDQDGAPDIVSFQILEQAGALRSFHNRGDRTFEQVVARAEPLIPMETGDFDRDGHVDTVLVRSTIPIEPATLVIALDHGAFETFDEYPIPSADLRVTAADVDSDRILDLVLVHRDHVTFTTELSVMRGNADGTFRARAPITTTLRGIKSFVVVDHDGDGQLDLGLAGSTDAQLPAIEWLLGTSDGVFVTTGEVISLPSDIDPISAVAIEVNGRPNPDLIVSAFHVDPRQQQVLVLPGDGGAAQLYDSGVPPENLYSVDVNRDGYLDVVVASQEGFAVLLRDNSGKLQPATAFPGRGRLAIADFDGDGRQDLASETGYVHYETRCLAR